MTEKTKELLLEIQNLSDILRHKLGVVEQEKIAFSNSNDTLQTQLSNAEQLVEQLKEDVKVLNAALVKAETNLVTKGNGGRNNETIDELVKEIDNYIENLKK